MPLAGPPTAEVQAQVEVGPGLIHGSRRFSRGPAGEAIVGTDGAVRTVAYWPAMETRPRPPLDPREDQRLVEACLAGDPRAWEALVRRHERLVYAVARSYRLEGDDLADVFQEVFAALVRGLPRLQEPRTLVRWLSSTTERIARAAALRARRERAIAPTVEPGILAGMPGPQAGVEADLERLEQQALLRLALESLAPRCRGLIQALYYEEPAPAYAEISRRLGIPVGSIGPTRSRCFERLRESLTRLQARSGGITDSPASTYHSDPPEKDHARGRRGPCPGVGDVADSTSVVIGARALPDALGAVPAPGREG